MKRTNEVAKGNLPKNLTLWRNAHHLNIPGLAKTISCTDWEIGQWESGAVVPDLAPLIRMAHTFRTSLDHLLFYPDVGSEACVASCILHALMCRVARLCMEEGFLTDAERAKFRTLILRITDLFTVEDRIMRQGNMEAVEGFVDALHDHIFPHSRGVIIQMEFSRVQKEKARPLGN